MVNITKAAMQATLYLIIICMLAWAIVPAWRTIAAGLVVGAAASAMNAFLLRRRIGLLAQHATSSDGKRVGTGLLSRIAMVLLAVMTAYRFPESVNLIATLAACFYVQIVVFIALIVQNNRHSSGKE